MKILRSVFCQAWLAALVLCTGAWAQQATFNSATGVLTLPAVKVGRSVYSNVMFGLTNPANYSFRLLAATAETQRPANIVFDPCTGVLTIPSVAVGATNYSVTMRLSDAGSYTFMLASASVIDTSTALPHFAPQASLIAPNVNWSSGFGTSIALSGNTLAVGTPGDASNARGINGNASNNLAQGSGAVNIFERSGGVWSHRAYIKASNADIADSFGASVALSGDTLVVGAPLEDSRASGINGDQADNGAMNSGAVYVFTRSNGVWTQQAYLKAANAGAGDEFGASVAVEGDTLVAGAHFEASGASGINGDAADNSKASSGAAYVFARTGAAWRQTAYLKPSNTTAGHEFGFSVALSGSTIAVGAYNEGGRGVGVNCAPEPGGSFGIGAVYIFTSNSGAWSQQAYVKASNSGSDAAFGWSLALSGDTLAVGSPKESNFGVGVNGNQDISPGADSGAVYVFTRSGSTWNQQAYIKASNSGLFDDFGWSVALAGDVLVVGSPYEDSTATGVNGDQRNNNVSNGGAAYVFRRAGATWSQVDYVKSARVVPSGIFGNSVALAADTLAVGAAGDFRGAAFVFAVP